MKPHLETPRDYILTTYLTGQEINTYIMHRNFIPTSIIDPHLSHVEPVPTRVTNHEKSLSPHINIMPLNYQSSLFTVVHARFVTTYVSNPSCIIHIRSCQTHHSLHVSPPNHVYSSPSCHHKVIPLLIRQTSTNEKKSQTESHTLA